MFYQSLCKSVTCKSVNDKCPVYQSCVYLSYICMKEMLIYCSFFSFFFFEKRGLSSSCSDDRDVPHLGFSLEKGRVILVLI